LRALKEPTKKLLRKQKPKIDKINLMGKNQEILLFFASRMDIDVLFNELIVYEPSDMLSTLLVLLNLRFDWLL
jgi:hypothetical protein